MARPSDLQKTVKQIVIPKQSPNPPSDLTLPEAQAWLALFESIEEGWITPVQYPLVAAYSRHVASADNIAKLIHVHEVTMNQCDTFTDDDIKMLDRLQKMLDRQHRAISSIMTKLRATNQSLRSSKEQNPTAKIRPWEDEDDFIEAEVIEESDDDETGNN